MHIASFVLATAFRDASVVGSRGNSSYFVDTSQFSLVENADDLDGRPKFALAKPAGALDLVVMRKAAVSMGADGVRSMYEKLHPVRRVRPGQVRSRGARE